MKKLATPALAAAVLGLAIGVSATVYHVPSQYPTIQAGIDAAPEGDTVLVADGTYTGDGNRDLDFGGVNMVVMSENGPEVTIIDCEGSEQDPHRGFDFHCVEDSNSVVKGFTIRNGYASGSGLAGMGGGIRCDTSSPTFEGNMIRENTAEDGGGGIGCRVSYAIIKGNTITKNASGWSGGGVDCAIDDSKILGNLIIGNISARGGGIGCRLGSAPRIFGNMIAGNVAVYGGGIQCFSGSPTIAGNTITANMADWWGGGIYCDHNSCPTIAGNTIAGNTAEDHGGGIYCSYYARPRVTNSILWGDSASLGQEIYLSSGWGGTSAIDVEYSDVEGGSSAVYVEPESRLHWMEGNIDADPIFVEQSWGDYRLLWGSPCIDSGDPDSLDPDGTRSDMGRYFFDQSKTLVTYLTPEAVSVHQGETRHVLYTLINCHDEPQPCWGVVTLTLPGGEAWPGNPLEGPCHGVMPPEFNWQYVREYTVPETWPLGMWGFTWKVGMPGNLFDQDRFMFTVVEPE